MFVRSSIFILCLLIMSACSTLPHGTFVQNLKSTDSTVIASDAVRQLTKIYPPASTTLSMQYAKNDLFGKALTKELRQAGFAVEAYLPNLLVAPESAPKTFPEASSGLELTYVLDRHEDLYRVLIRVDDEVLTRAYLAQADKVLPAGEWMQKKR